MSRHEPFVSMVRDGMRRRGLTLRSFCRAVLLDPSFFSKVLSGKRSPPSEEAVLRRIALVLGIPPPELIVAAGRIPSEWGRLVRNPALFGDVHRLASSTLPTGDGQRVRQPTAWAARGGRSEASPSTSVPQSGAARGGRSEASPSTSVPQSGAARGGVSAPAPRSSAEAGPAEAGASPASIVRKDLATELL